MKKVEDPRSQSINSPSPRSVLTWLKKIFTKLTSSLYSSKKIISNNTDNYRKLIEFFENRGISIIERKILNNFSHFIDKTVGDIVIPRADISAIKVDATIKEVSKVIKTTGHTRILVYKEEPDDIVGFLHIKDLYRVVTNEQKFVMEQILRTPLSLVGPMKLLDALVMMQREQIHIALVIDEYGSLDGIITIEDIIEALLGPIEDEHDQTSISYKKIDDRTLIIPARAKIADIEQIIGKTLKQLDEECETIGGLILARSGHMVAAGTKLHLSPEIIAEVIDASPRILKQIKLILVIK